MNLAALDLNLLVALEALLEEASVGRAADRVSLSQPAMSHALKRLRSLLGDPLLVRVGGRMDLTKRAQGLRHPVKDALSRVRDLLVSETFDPMVSTRTFRLFVADNASDLLLPPLLERLHKSAPNISIQVHAGLSTSLNASELARSVDVAIACVPHYFPGFYQRRLFTDRDVCAVGHENPVANRLASLRAFLQAAHVAVVGREFREDPVDTWLREEGYERKVVLTVLHYLQALHVVSESDLVAVLPYRLITAHAHVLQVKAIEVPLDAGTFDEYLLHPATSHTDAGNVWLRGVLWDVAKSLGPLRAYRSRRMRSALSASRARSPRVLARK